MDALRIGEQPPLPIEGERFARKAPPQTFDRLDGFARAGIALIGRGHLVQTEIVMAVQGGDDVPAGASLADPIEREKLPCDEKGRIKGGRSGGQKADMGRFAGDRGEEDRRIETGKARAFFESGPIQIKRVGPKDEVELRSLRPPGNIHVKLCFEKIFDPAIGPAPGFATQPGGRERQADMKGFSCRHDLVCPVSGRSSLASRRIYDEKTRL